MGFLNDLSARDAVSLGVSLTAAGVGAYMLFQSTDVFAQLLGGKKTQQLKKKKEHQMRMKQVETLIMERGERGTKDFRVHVLAKGADDTTVAELSLWHDVPLVAPQSKNSSGPSLFNFICEIPKCTRKKFEVATKEGATPIKQDEKKGVLREFKKGDIFFNYGCFPRTWEDPRHVSPDTGYPGDNDPLDVCEIGLRQCKTGEIRPVKVLGVLAMIDDDETDWKIVAIDAEDRWAPELNDVDDVERLIPGTISLIREWFRTYKIPDGNAPNKFALDERCMPAAYALKVISETHDAWSALVSSQRLDSGLHLPADRTKLQHVDRDTKIVRTLSQSNLAQALSA
ncbi:inorganic pyrophosphatase [Pelagophyceae sp. CCMP2097]|nr:inorganic pyrophosphatase [Pelagophyceae sp. CCMP2097]|mmetsp:Transcript_16507/g.55719  ORF Transcript_16507/g.55719 Transcript_16507/m.55719 type:complete len:341 (+) Transcript_16507:64-1086(+)|eukprot:CAMPEP_0184084484 /NCGR_PEP_ID=MMETSP0974-20121125/4229_1 /TAXON_ID=483370 /ORGANISM="non described non described, Strain CCMP2097" /LENGTH=340 /DNA_ID=CAMNT_0026387159 /DNA_START=28 /DNA_END=1050 /DNA_ORIENTATION=-